MNVVGVGVCAEVPPAADVREERARRTMSKAAVLAVHATRAAVESAGWTDVSEVGQFVGVGPSGGSLEDLEKLLRGGVRSAHPLLAFQLMNNFAMCHAAIDRGFGGPNRAVYSTGAGTVFAWVQALLSRADRFVVCGTDTPTHPVTRHSLGAGEWTDGAAMLAIERGGTGPRVKQVRFVGRAQQLPSIEADWVGLSGGRSAPAGWHGLGARSPAAEAARGWVEALRAPEEPGIHTAAAVCWDDDGQLGWVIFEEVP